MLQWVMGSVAGSIAGAVLDRVKDVIVRLLPPEKMSEGERARFEQEMQKAVLEMDWQRFNAEIEDVVSARLLAQKELERGNAFTNSLAALHRPLWSFACLALFVLSVVDSWIGMPDLPIQPEQYEIMKLVIWFYFGLRTGEKGMQMWERVKQNGNGRAVPVTIPSKPGARTPARPWVPPPLPPVPGDNRPGVEG